MNPYYEGNPLQKMINDDRFLMKTLDKWLFGDDYTGNIYEEKNLESLRREVLKIGPIHLVINNKFRRPARYCAYNWLSGPFSSTF